MSHLALKDKFLSYCKRVLFIRGIDLDNTNLPLYTFAPEEISFNLNTTNNTIQTPEGFFRICFEHLSYQEYIKMLTVFYDNVPDNQKPKRGYDFFINKGVRDWILNGKRHRYQTYNVSTAMAEEAVAKLLGVSHLLTQSTLCRLRIGANLILVGSMSRDAGGVDIRALKDCYQDLFTPNLVKELASLNLIDAICYEKDHRPGNYHIILDESGNAVSVCCFDNDSPWAFSPFGRVDFRPYDGASSIIKNGVFNRPLLDSSVASYLMHLQQNEVLKSLSPFLGIAQVKACWKRIKTLQNAIANTQFKYDDWSETVMNEELSGKYGKTYYSILYELCGAIKRGEY